MTSHSATIEQVRAVKERALAAFSRLARVVGVGITSHGSGYALKVNVAEKPAESKPLPTEFDGVPVRVEVVGALRKRKRD